MGPGNKHRLKQLKKRLQGQSPEYLEKKVQALKARLFQEQLQFIEDTSKKKVLICGRRSGKTTALAYLLVIRAITEPRFRGAYVCLTRQVAKDNLWGDLKQILDEFEIPYKPYVNALEIRFLDNGSLIKLTGCETEADADKFRGQKYDLVAIDEAKSYPTTLLRILIKEVLGPLMHDKGGTMILMGTPGNILAGPFYEVSGPDAGLVLYDQDNLPYVKSIPYQDRGNSKYQGIEDYWTFHHWTAKENTKQPQIWLGFLKDKRSEGWSDDNPEWRREYLGQWLPKSGLKVYNFDPSRRYNQSGERDLDRECVWDPQDSAFAEFSLPQGHEWIFICGLDLGWHDDTAFTVAAYSKTSPFLYHVYSFSAPHMLPPAIVKKLKELDKRFGGFEAIVADTGNLGKMVMEHIQRNYGIIFKQADKTKKNDHIELLNSDLHDGRVKIIRNSILADELLHLQWADDQHKKTAKGLKDHQTDSLLYLWRYSRHFDAKQPSLTPEIYSEAYFEAQEAAEDRRLLLEQLRSNDLDSWGSDIELDRPQRTSWLARRGRFR